jgi:CrcB protein
VTNVTGCLVIGALMVLISEVWTTHRLVRPFLGVGVVGSFTTFSAYTVETQQLLDAGRAPVALGYLFGTLAAALLAVQLGVVLTRLGARRRVRRGG